METQRAVYRSFLCFNTGSNMPTSFLTVVCLTYAKQPSKMEMPHSKQSVPWLFFFMFLFFPRSNINLPFSIWNPRFHVSFLVTTEKMLFCPSLQKLGSLKAVNQILLKPLFFGLANPTPFNHSSEVMFTRPLIFLFGLTTADPNFPLSFFLSVFIKYNGGEERTRVSVFSSAALHGNLSGSVALLGFCSLCCHLFCVFSCLALVEELPQCIKRRINIFLYSYGCAAGLRVVQRSTKNDCLHTQGIHPQTRGCL